MMQQRQLGNSSLNFSTVGIGTWAIGGGDWKFGWGPQDEDEAIEAILTGTRLGINWIDTAAVYSMGEVEKYLSQMHSKVIQILQMP